MLHFADGLDPCGLSYYTQSGDGFILNGTSLRSTKRPHSTRYLRNCCIYPLPA
jgi:hypothetical protein